MLASCERGWRYRYITDLPASELAFIKQLAVDRKSWLLSEFMDFEIGHHQLIHRLLENLNGEFLSECRAYFGGGTVISLDHCYENLTISETFRSQLIDGIDLLAIDLCLEKTSRTISESGDDIFPFI